MYDYHVHSMFSGDCKYTMEEMVLAAIDKNIKSLSFTDHIDYDYGSGNYSSEINFVFNTEDYMKEFKKIKNNYKNQIEILSGVELGMQPHLVDKIHELLPLDIFDFILMSVHTVKRQDLHEGEFFENKSAIKSYEEYYEDLYTCLDKFDNFDIVGHLNLIDRYSKYLNESVKFEDYKEIISEVLKKIISKGKGIEINTSGIRYGMESFLPNLDILKLYKSLGGEIITFGSDSHKPEDIGFAYNDVIKLLKELDFKYLTIFKNRKKQFINI
ncbi:histidinol-phosphatase HisK [Gottschalkia purinilytica]|uniref:Histidinol-phosphatase n=1 Tax=Gottschalkia purinilytica TaxID=1503 RepID=A0A0L0WDE3_GOTPU|nr:histidinol-phosphatase HisJ family protein [Gottschalkia purinilytica]KNF09493.1 histidinol-phosphatase HisK [Gottschalkia purinilytica]